MIRFGIVGAGNIARKFAYDIQAASNAKAVAIASRSKKRSTEFQREFDLDVAFDSYDALFQSTEVDAIYIATPHSYHFEQAINAMNHGKHVLCEKPISVNTKQLQEMIEVAQKNNVLLMEAMWTSFLPVYQTLDSWRNEGILGSLLSVDIRFGYELTPHVSKKGRLLNPALAGGSLLDIGVYPISVLHRFIDSEYTMLKTQALMSKTEVDLYLVMDLTLDNPQQTPVHLESAIDRELSNEAILEFENGILRIPNFHQATSFQWKDKTYEFPHKLGGFEYQIESFSTSIMNQESVNPIRTHDDSLKCMKWMDDVRSKIRLLYPFE